MNFRCQCSEFLSLPYWTETLLASIGGSCTVTSVVAFSLLPHNFERWLGRIDGTLSFFEYRLRGGDTQTLYAVIKSFQLFALWCSGNTKTSLLCHLVQLSQHLTCLGREMWIDRRHLSFVYYFFNKPACVYTTYQWQKMCDCTDSFTLFIGECEQRRTKSFKTSWNVIGERA